MTLCSRRFDEKIVIVTGGATGIGRAVAMRLATEGASVVIADVNSEFGTTTEQGVRNAGGQSQFIRCDVSRSSDVQTMVDTVMARHGRIDVLVNNAGIPGPLVPIDQLAEADWERVLSINLGGVFHCTRYALPGLLASGAGAMVNIASTFGMVGAPNTPAYAAAKGGVIALTRQLAVDLGSRGIRVNAVSPGYVDNDMDQRRDRMTPEAAAANLASREATASLQPLGRLGDVGEIAAVIAFLASDEASFITGAVVPVDGGCTAFFNLGHRQASDGKFEDSPTGHPRLRPSSGR
ncbi:MAG: 3-oxoacyl-ACP reductase FabG [Chloroflexia bacterium]|nr:3-oxoacyl-ACP reductase FabG [Chloroflexia bacterium]